MTVSLDTLRKVYERYIPGYSNGVWSGVNVTNWACASGGGATAAATLYAIGGRDDPGLLNVATTTVNTAIDIRQQSIGTFISAIGTPNPNIDQVDSIFWGAEMAMTTMLLAPDLRSDEMAKWQTSLRALGDFYVKNKNLTWYANGNVNLQLAELFWMVWRVTGDPKYLTDYQQMLAFTEHPDPARWPGRGEIITTPPTSVDDRDGAGYFAETGAGGTGYDPEYTELQLTAVARLALLSGDPEAMRLTNLLVDQLLRRVDQTTWTLDASGGTRHTQPVRQVPFLTPALVILGRFGGRSDLLPLIDGQQAATQATYLAPGNDNDAYRRGLGNDLSVSALAEARYSFGGLT